MAEGPPKEEAGPSPGFEAFTALVEKGEWTPETEAALARLLERYEEDLLDVLNMYTESLGPGGTPITLPEHERRMYEWLAAQFDS